jgi:hypothetical protein
MWVTPDRSAPASARNCFSMRWIVRHTQVREIEISADPNAAGFYERMGASQIGETESQHRWAGA